jgi:hypothetical protein
MSDRKAKIGLIQVTQNPQWEAEQCFDELLTLAENCLKEKADLVFMPEAYQYWTERQKRDIRELVSSYADDYRKKCSANAWERGQCNGT